MLGDVDYRDEDVKYWVISFVITIVLVLAIFGAVLLVTVEEDTKEEPLEVYSFLVDGEIILRCVEESNLSLSNVCPVRPLPIPIYMVLQVMPDPSEGTVLIYVILELNDTEAQNIWVLTITDVIANTSRGLIKDRGLESVSFLPPRTLVVVALFDFIMGTFEYHGSTYSSPSSSPTN